MSDFILLAYDDMAKLEAEINSTGSLLLHLTVFENKWNKSKLKEWLEDWEKIKFHLKQKGYDEIYTIVPKTDIKVNKFQKMFGFIPILEVADAIIYRQEI